MKPPVFSSTDLELLQRQLDSFRQQQVGSRRLPQELWDAAGRLAVQHGVSHVSRTLRLGFHKVRRACERQRGPVPSAPVPGRLVEVRLDPGSPPAGANSGWVELIRGPNQRMRIHTGHDPASWVVLAPVPSVQQSDARSGKHRKSCIGYLFE